jgi:hypothetical protein
MIELIFGSVGDHERSFRRLVLYSGTLPCRQICMGREKKGAWGDA